MPTITLYGGAGTIGGNKILLEDGDSRLFFDFGTSFAERGRFYEEYLNPRSSYGLLDPLTMGLLPPLRGLYRPDLEQGLPALWDDLQGARGFRDLRDIQVGGVLLSHAHLDHSGYISFLRREVPILTSALTAFVAKAIQDSGRSDFESEVVYAVPRQLNAAGLLESGHYAKVAAQQRPFHVFDRAGLSAEARSFWEETPGARGLDPISLSAASDAGGLEVRCFPVDHSIPGACAFAVNTSAGWVAYTGDLRLHGSRGELTRRFIQEIGALKPTVLLCEGTRAAPEGEGEPNHTEHDVQERALREVREAQGLVIADFGARNVERLLIFADIARETGRALVILPKDAYLLKAANLADPSIPSVMGRPDLYVYDEPKLRIDRWERTIRQECEGRMVGPTRIQQRQDQYILCFSFYDLDELPTIRPGPGSLYLYSSHEAFSEELQLDFRRLRAWVDHFGMRQVGLPLEELEWEVPEEEQGLHASGHASADDIMEFVRQIKPHTVVPIHTENPGYFREHLRGTEIEVVIRGYGESWTF